MTSSSTPNQQSIRLFGTEAHACSYLPERLATTQFVDPAQAISDVLAMALLEHGFRRSGEHFYRPHCEQCQACQSLRIPVRDFRSNRSQRRNLQANTGITRTLVEPQLADHDQYYPLYQEYINQRHAHGDMAPASRDQYDRFIAAPWRGSYFLEFRLAEQLIMVSQFDQVPRGISAIYTFYYTSLIKRGLGTFAILQQVELCRAIGLDYLYLGYWISGSATMDYKRQFRPHEIYTGGRWQRL